MAGAALKTWWAHLQEGNSPLCAHQALLSDTEQSSHPLSNQEWQELYYRLVWQQRKITKHIILSGKPNNRQ